MITAAALTFPHPQLAVTSVPVEPAALPPRRGCDLLLHSQGHDLQLPYQRGRLVCAV